MENKLFKSVNWLVNEDYPTCEDREAENEQDAAKSQDQDDKD